MGKATISMAILNGYVSLPEGTASGQVGETSIDQAKPGSILRADSPRVISQPWKLVFNTKYNDT